MERPPFEDVRHLVTHITFPVLVIWKSKYLLLNYNAYVIFLFRIKNAFPNISFYNMDGQNSFRYAIKRRGDEEAAVSLRCATFFFQNMLLNSFTHSFPMLWLCLFIFQITTTWMLYDCHILFNVNDFINNQRCLNLFQNRLSIKSSTSFIGDDIKHHQGDWNYYMIMRHSWSYWDQLYIAHNYSKTTAYIKLNMKETRETTEYFAYSV